MHPSPDMLTICDGIIRVRGNAFSLLEDAKLLRSNARISRAYALAYLACEESGKISILVGVAIRISRGVPIDWKKSVKRFRSHDSKASQFLGLARVLPAVIEAAAAGKTVDTETLMAKATAGVLLGPALFATRNASIYSDFEKGAFTSPDEQITDSMADEMITHAENHVFAADVVLGKSAGETAAIISGFASRMRYDDMIASSKQAANLLTPLPEKKR